MANGFKAWTATGLFQIDGTTPNFQLTSRQYAVCSVQSLPTVYNNVGTQFYASYHAVTFTFTASTPMVAFRADGNARCCPWKFTRSGNTYTATFICESNVGITLWVFDSNPPNSTFGLKCWDGSGNLVANAVQPFAKVLDVIQGAYFAGTGWYASGGQMPGNNPQTRSYGGLPVAFAACYPCHYMEGSGDSSSGGTVNSTNMSGLKASGDTIGWEFFTFAGTRSGNFVGFRESTAYSFLVLDMSGIP